MRSETVGRILFLSLLALSVYLMYLIFVPFLPGIAWAVVLVVVFQPVYARLVIWLHGRDLLAAVLLSAMVGAFIVVPTILAVLQIGKGVVQAYTWLSAQLALGRSPLEIVQGIPVMSQVTEWIGQYVDLEEFDVRGMALSWLQGLGNTLAAQSRSLLSNIFHTVITLVVLLVTMVVLFHQWPRVVQVIQRFVPLSDADKADVFAQLRAATRAVFYGVMLTAFVQGVLGAIGFLIVGIPAALMFGAAMFFAALLPAGPMLVWVPAVGWLFLSGQPGRAVILLLWGALVVGTADNVLRPIFIGRGLRMHMLLVFFGIFGGMFAFGLIGLFTGPLVITLFLFLLEVARRDLFRDLVPSRPGATSALTATSGADPLAGSVLPLGPGEAPEGRG